MSNNASPTTVNTILPPVTEKVNLKELCSKVYNHPQFKWIIIFILFIVGLYFYLVVNKKKSICPFNQKKLKITKLDKKLIADTDDDSSPEPEEFEQPPVAQPVVQQVKKRKIQQRVQPVVEHIEEESENEIEHNQVEELLSEEDNNIKNEDLTTEEMRQIDEQLEEININ